MSSNIIEIEHIDENPSFASFEKFDPAIKTREFEYSALFQKSLLKKSYYLEKKRIVNALK
jgi:hypothetical protein